MKQKPLREVKVLIITSEWPTKEHPEWVPFLVQQVDSLRKAGVDVSVFHFRGNKNPLRYFKAWLKLRGRFPIKEFDLIHAQFGQSGLLALPVQIPLVVTFHGSDLQGDVGKEGHYTWAGELLRLLSRFVTRMATQIIVVSHHLVDLLPSYKTCHVIPCGVDLDLFKPIDRSEARRMIGIPQHKRYVAFIANPRNPIKRYELAREAVRLLQKEFDVELLTVSGVSHEEVPLYMNASDVLVLTSIHEGSPTVVKEALACNLPVVSVDVGDVRERIGDVDGCVLCADDSPETIAVGLARVLRKGGRIEGRKAVADLDERLVAEHIISVYHEALSGM